MVNGIPSMKPWKVKSRRTKRASVFWLCGVPTRKHHVNPRFSHFSRRDVGCYVAKLSGSSMRTSPEVYRVLSRLLLCNVERYAVFDRDAPHIRVEQFKWDKD